MVDITAHFTDIVKVYTASKVVSAQLRFQVEDENCKLFLTLAKQKAALPALKKETMNHIYATESHGKIVFEPLNDIFGQLQSKIADIESKIIQNEAVIAELGQFYQQEGLDEPSLEQLTARLNSYTTQIKAINKAAGAKTYPIRAACEIAKTDYVIHPKIVAIEAKAASEIAPIAAARSKLESQIKEIRAILAKVVA